MGYPIGFFYAFLGDAPVGLTGVEAGGEGITRGRHAARFQGGKLAPTPVDMLGDPT